MCLKKRKLVKHQSIQLHMSTVGSSLPLLFYGERYVGDQISLSSPSWFDGLCHLLWSGPNQSQEQVCANQCMAPCLNVTQDYLLWISAAWMPPQEEDAGRKRASVHTKHWERLFFSEPVPHVCIENHCLCICSLLAAPARKKTHLWTS